MSHFEAMFLTAVEETLPNGWGMHSTLDGDADFFGRPPEHGVMFVAQTTCTSSRLKCSGGAGAHFYICGTDASQSNANNCHFMNPRSGGANGRGYWVQGENANTCLITNPEMSDSAGYGYYNDGFLGSTLLRPHCEVADGATYYQTTGDTIDAYIEESTGLAVVLGGTFSTTDAGYTLFHSASDNDLSRVYITGSGRYQTGVTVGRVRGGTDQQIGDPNAGLNLRYIVTDDWYSGLKASHYEVVNPSIADGAISWYWDTSLNVTMRLMGANPTGSGVLRLPRGVELCMSTDDTPRRWLKATSGAPSDKGWYQIGDFYADIYLGGTESAAKATRFGYTPLTEFGIGTAFSSGSTVRVGDAITSGGVCYIVTAIIDGTTSGNVDQAGHLTNLRTGSLGTGGPSDPGSGGHTVDSGTARLYRLANEGATGNLQVISIPSPPLQSQSGGVGTPSSPYGVGILSAWTNRGSSLSMDRGLYFASTSAIPGDQHTHSRDYGGDYDDYIYDADGTTLLAILPAGTFNSVKVQWNGSNWKLQHAPSTVVRRFKSRAELAAVPVAVRAQGNVAHLDEDGSTWMFSASSTASDSTSLMVVTPGSGCGRWLRTDKTIDIKVAFSSATADATALWTTPTFTLAPYAAGARLAVLSAYWEITSNVTGTFGLGISSNNSKFNTKGDLLGGASGDTSSNLTHGNLFAGTLGTKAGAPGNVLVGGNTIRFDVISGSMTGGSGYVHARLGVLS